MQLKMFMQYIPTTNNIERFDHLILIINDVTKEGQNESSKDTRALTHLPTKLKGSGEVHGYANGCDEQIGNTRRGLVNSDILLKTYLMT